MKIEFTSTPAEKRLSELKAIYGDDWSLELTSFLGCLIHYKGRSRNGLHTFSCTDRILVEDINLLNEDRSRRGLPVIHSSGWR